MKRWSEKKCGCVKTSLPTIGCVMIRCDRHRGKRTKKGRLLAHFDEHGIVRRG